MYFDILTLFPEMFTGPFSESIISRAREKDIIEINLIDFREFATDRHKKVDDYPYGGGSGMVLKPEPIYRAYKQIVSKRNTKPPTILMTPRGKKLTQDLVKKYSKNDGLIIICGHYEGVDERIRETIVTDEISIGDYVLTGGELPAMVFVESIARMLPGVLGDENSKKEDSFFNGLLDYPQYTRPRVFKDKNVPEILLSGHHQNIKTWRKKMALKNTLVNRPDLIDKKELSKEEEKLIAEIMQEIEEQENGYNHC